MNKLLSTVVCVALVSSFPALSAEEKSASPHSAQTITIPDSLDGYTLTMTSKEIKYVHIGNYIPTLDDGAIVKNGEIGNYYEKYKEEARPYPVEYSKPPFHATIIFSKKQWAEGQSSGGYTCKKIGKDKLHIEWTRSTIEGGDAAHIEYDLFLHFKTSDAGNAYFLEEEDVGGNISFKLKKSSEKQ